MLFVPDASVLLKWTLGPTAEPDHDRAEALKALWLADRCELVVPTLWVYEVGNILALKRPAAGGELLQAMIDLGLREVAPQSCLPRILTLVKDYRVTFYDAAYHALAAHLGGTMITADAAYLRKAGGAGSVVLLAAWQP